MKVNIRKFSPKQLATSPDFVKICKMSYGPEGYIFHKYLECLQSFWSPRKRDSDLDFEFYVAYYRNQPVAVLLWDYGDTSIQNWTVKKYRRKGLMRKLIDHAYRNNTEFRKQAKRGGIGSHHDAQDNILADYCED